MNISFVIIYILGCMLSLPLRDQVVEKINPFLIKGDWFTKFIVTAGSWVSVFILLILSKVLTKAHEEQGFLYTYYITEKTKKRELARKEFNKSRQEKKYFPASVLSRNDPEETPKKVVITTDKTNDLFDKTHQ
jgi:hypothetical protein